MEENQYFVQIRDASDIRRNLLGSSKQIIQILQRYEKIKDLRAKKLEKMAKLKSINKEINLLAVKLRKQLPEADFRLSLENEEPRPTRQKKEVKQDALKKLEEELKMIENKIGMLS